MAGRIPRNAAGIGCRGGTSATAGRRAAVYRFTMPDGRVLERRSFKVLDEQADVHVSRYRGQWFIDGIRRPGARASGALVAPLGGALPSGCEEVRVVQAERVRGG